jgi:hypothetical protein
MPVSIQRAPHSMTLPKMQAVTRRADRIGRQDCVALISDRSISKLFLAEAFADAITIPIRFGAYTRLINGQHTALLHHQFAIDDNALDI